ncbi:MAG: hypothetical protein JWP77_2128, partial [Polaromonas sp.]|nr:hypothetical protein [Polaromonas sp.]
MAGVQSAEQRGELGPRGCAGKGGPAARQPVRRGQPGAHCAQQTRPARQRLGAAGFYSRLGWRYRRIDRWGERVAGVALTGSVPPAKGKRAAHDRPVAADRPVASNHEVGPAELIQHPLVALFHPVAQTVRTDARSRSKCVFRRCFPCCDWDPRVSNACAAHQGCGSGVTCPASACTTGKKLAPVMAASQAPAKVGGFHHRPLQTMPHQQDRTA